MVSAGKRVSWVWSFRPGIVRVQRSCRVSTSPPYLGHCGCLYYFPINSFYPASLLVVNGTGVRRLMDQSSSNQEDLGGNEPHEEPKEEEMEKCDEPVSEFYENLGHENLEHSKTADQIGEIGDRSGK
jgi:hypothetical protein